MNEYEESRGYNCHSLARMGDGRYLYAAVSLIQSEREAEVTTATANDRAGIRQRLAPVISLLYPETLETVEVTVPLDQ